MLLLAFLLLLESFCCYIPSAPSVTTARRCPFWCWLPYSDWCSFQSCCCVAFCCWHICGKFVAAVLVDTGVLDTGGKFATGVNDTGGQWKSPERCDQWPPVSMTPVVHLDLRISPRIFEKIRNNPNIIIRGLGEDDSWKKPEASRETVPFIRQQLREDYCIY